MPGRGREGPAPAFRVPMPPVSPSTIPGCAGGRTSLHVEGDFFLGGAAMISVSVRLRAAAAAAFISASALLAATPASAEDRRVNIINETSYTIVEFYASNVGENAWEEDILGRDMLAPDESVVIDIDDGSGHCLYDFRAVFEDGDELVKNRINVCQIESYSYTD